MGRELMTRWTLNDGDWVLLSWIHVPLRTDGGIWIWARKRIALLGWRFWKRRTGLPQPLLVLGRHAFLYGRFVKRFLFAFYSHMDYVLGEDVTGVLCYEVGLDGMNGQWWDVHRYTSEIEEPSRSRKTG